MSIIKRLDGKIAIVTGATTGVGAAIARAFAAEGAKVILAGRNQENGNNVRDGIIGAGGSALFIKTDMRSREDVKALVGAAMKEYGRIDILVNNAAVMLYKMFEECTLDDFNNVMETNLRGYFYSMWEVLPIMRKQCGGSVINVSSINSHRANPGQSIYSAFKAAVNQGTKCLAQEYAEYNVRLNLILPGPVKTNMIPWELGTTEEEIWEKVAATVPLKKVAEPEDIAGVAVFLASDEASLITSAAYVVDGGIN